MLMGAIFVETYGYTNGIMLGVICLFTTTMIAGVICFSMARDHFQQFVLKKLSKSESLKMLRNMDRLIQDGQGFEMVLLIRLAPLPTGPTYYFLGTTSVTWNDFLAGNSLTNLLFAVTDILIGAGAKSMRTDNPVGIAIFVICLAGFCLLVCYVGLRAKRKLEALDDQDQVRQREQELKGDFSTVEEARRSDREEAALVKARFTKDGRLKEKSTGREHHKPIPKQKAKKSRRERQQSLDTAIPSIPENEASRSVARTDAKHKTSNRNNRNEKDKGNTAEKSARKKERHSSPRASHIPAPHVMRRLNESVESDDTIAQLQQLTLRDDRP